MQGDSLLQQWKNAKKICYKIVQISKSSHLYQKQNIPQLQKQKNQQFLNVYDIVYRLCTAKQKEQTRVLMVYRQYKDILKNALMDMCQIIKSQKDIYKLRTIKKIWDAYIDIQKRLIHMFAYLNRPYHIKEGNIEDLDKTGVNIILQTLFNETSVAEYEMLYFKQLQKIRKQQDFSNSKILLDLVDIFYKIHLKLIKNNKKAQTIYTNFHSKYLQYARQFYQKRYKMLKELNPSEYFQEVNDIYNVEVKIAESCFGIAADVLINKDFSAQFIEKYRHILLNSPYGLKSILQNRQMKVLKIIVDLNLKLTKNIDGFKEQFEEFVFDDIKTYIDMIKNQMIAKGTVLNYCNFIQKLIRKNHQFQQILERSLNNLGDFAHYYKSGAQKAFSSAKLPLPIQQILTIYTDTKLKNSSISEEELQQEIKNILGIFNCLQNKDLFMIKYSQKLAKRILDLSQEALQHHECFVSNLKFNCGMKYTQNLQTIITQYKISVDNQKFIHQIIEREKITIGITIKIFSEGVWPTQNCIQLPSEFFPKEIQQAYNVLSIYREEFNSKKTFKISALETKIRWIYYFDQSLQLKEEKCYFQTNSVQGAILYYVYRNRPNRVSLKVIEQVFQKITPKLLHQSLNKMSDHHQTNILSKSQDHEQHFYSFNQLMKYSKRSISYISGNRAEQDKLFQQHDLGKDREMVLDANIVKFMKSKKVSDFQTLQTQIPKMIKVFVPQNRDIKTSIDRLISKQFLKRDESNMAIIKYVD